MRRQDAGKSQNSLNARQGSATLTFYLLLTGDFITALTGKPFYITSSRYRSMVTDYVTPMEKTFTLLGQPGITLEQGVQETVSWLHSQGEYYAA